MTEEDIELRLEECWFYDQLREIAHLHERVKYWVSILGVVPYLVHCCSQSSDPVVIV